MEREPKNRNSQEEYLEKGKLALMLTAEALRELNGKGTTEKDKSGDERRAEVYVQALAEDGVRLLAIGGGHEKLKASRPASGRGPLYFKIYDNGMDQEYIKQLEDILENKFRNNGLEFRRST